MMDCVYNPTLKSPYTKDKVNNSLKGRIPKVGWIKYCLRIPLQGGYMEDYRQNPPTAEDINMDLLFTVAASQTLPSLEALVEGLTVCMFQMRTSW